MATIRKSSSGKYFASILVETETESLPACDRKVGIDLGVKDFAVLSTGEAIPNPKYLRKYEQKLVRWQRILSRRKKGGSNWHKARLKVARLHEKVANCRKDFLHKLSTRLIHENQVICLEDLQVQNMQKNHHLAKSIADVSWSTFAPCWNTRQSGMGSRLCWWTRPSLSSQLCSSCGYRNRDVKNLGLRE